jgi:hypothetical protein
LRKTFCDYCDFEIPDYSDAYDLYDTNGIDVVEIIIKSNGGRTHVHHECKLKLIEELIIKRLKQELD